MAVQPLRSEKHSTIGYKVALGILVLIIIALLAFSPLVTLGGPGDKTQAENNVRTLYKTITGAEPEIIKTADQNGIYKITLRFKDASGRDALQDVFVTRDGAFFTDRLVDVALQTSVLANQSSFASCLADKQVRVLGLSSDPNTQAQLQVLGAFSSRIYFDCGGDNLAICQQLNITQVPVIFANGSLYQGPQNLAWFEQTVGCTLSANATVPAA